MITTNKNPLQFKMKNILGVLFLLISTAVFAQKQERPLVQFSGVIHNADSVKVIVPYVTITNVSNHGQVNLANYEGYFSFVVHEQDTLTFTSIGYAPETIVVPANVVSKSYTLTVLIKPQIINLPTFHVFPWATTDEFKKDFLTMKLADDDLEIAKKNVSRSSIYALINRLPRDGQEIQAANAQAEHFNLLNSHSTVNPLLSPVAWGSLIQQISEGDRSRQTVSTTGAGSN